MLTCAPELHYDYIGPQLAFLLVLVLVHHFRNFSSGSLVEKI